MKRFFLMVRRNFWGLLLALVVIFAFFANALHESYPDEFDNILGGWYILHGRLPYSGFFTHHGPVPYFIAAFIAIFSGQSFVKFRILYAIFLLLVTLVIYLFLKNRVGKKEVSFYPFFTVFLGILGTYYWLEMLLADNIAALSFLPAYGLILLKTVYRKSLMLVDVVIISMLSAIGLYSSLTYIYLYAILMVSTFYIYLKDHYLKKILAVQNFLPFLIFLLPHVFFLFYLLMTGSFMDYYYQNFTFNAKYYIYNYPRIEGSSFINPIRYAILITHWFLTNFYTLLTGVGTFNFGSPINMTMAVGNVATVFYLLFQKHYKLAFVVFLVLTFTNVRSNPLNSRETDYQAAVYNLISFFNIFFLLPRLYESINEKIGVAKKAVFGFLFLLVGIYSLFSLFHLVFKFNDRVVSKYMGTMPLVYDRPALAPIVNSIVEKNEYMWIGPFAFEELFYAKAQIPSKYHILIYGVAAGEKTREEMLADFNKNKPVVIMFDKYFSYLGKTTNDYSLFFVDFLNENYVILPDYRNGELQYQSVLPVTDKLNLETNMYIRKDRAQDIIQKLFEENYIKESKID